MDNPNVSSVPSTGAEKSLMTTSLIRFFSCLNVVEPEGCIFLYISELLSESPEIEIKRNKLNMSMKRIITAIEMIKSY